MRTQYISTFVILMISCSPIFAQKKHQNKFDTTFARPYELSVAIGTTSTANHFPMGNYDNGVGPSFSIGYSRVYKFNHFLRTGLQISNRSSDDRPHYFFPAIPTQADNMPDNYSTQKLAVQNRTSNTFANVYVGYEYGVGVRRFRFTFGADLLIGFHRRRMTVGEDSYLESRTLDPVSGLYQYNLTYLSSGSLAGRSSNIFMALSPRIGIRRELGRRMALALTFTPQVGFTQRLRYSEKIIDARPTQYYNPKSAWFMSQNAELRLIIKLGKY